MALTGRNTYTGGTTVNAGTLVLGAAAADGSGSLTINSATVSANVDNAFGSGGIILASATLLANNHQELSLGTLTLGKGVSLIDFSQGSNNGVFAFADSSNAAWDGSGNLYVYNWHGNPTGGIPGDGYDHLFFGNSVTGLTTTQLSAIHFFSDSAMTPLNNVKILATGEVVAATDNSTPEPKSLYTLIFGSVIFLGFCRQPLQQNRLDRRAGEA